MTDVLETYGSPATRVSRQLRAPLLWFALVLFAHAPLLVRFALEQWGRPQYQFFPFLVVAGVVLAWRRLHELSAEDLRPGERWLADVLASLSLTLFLASGMLWASRGASYSFGLAAVAIAYRYGGRPALRALAPSLVLLALITGPPAGYDEWLLQKLRQLAVAIADGVLVLLDVPHLMAGTIIEVPNARLLVAEACSGINSLMAVTGCTLVLAFWRRRGVPAIVVLLVAGILAVLWANVVRISGGAYLKAQWNIDILSGDAHQLTSVVLFSICMLLVLCTDSAISMLDWVFQLPSAPETAAATVATPVARLVQLAQGVQRAGRVPLEFWLVPLIALVASALFMVHAQQNGGIPRWVSSPSVSHLPADAVFDAPRQIGTWERIDDSRKLITRPEIEGMQSQVWAYSSGGTTVILALDYPFAGFHDLTVCYRNTGWTILNDRTVTPQPGAGFYDVIELARVHERGYLWYSSLNEQGDWIQKPDQSNSGRLWRRMSTMSWPVCTYQVQLWLQSYDDLSAQQQADLGALFLAFRETMGKQVMAQLRGER